MTNVFLEFSGIHHSDKVYVNSSLITHFYDCGGYTCVEMSDKQILIHETIDKVKTMLTESYFMIKHLPTLPPNDML